MGSAAGGTERTVATPRILPALVLAPLAMVPGDPTVRLGRASFERASLTPDGPGVLRIAWGGAAGEVTVAVHGPGGAWLDGRAEYVLGLHDDVSTFAPTDPVVRTLWSMFGGDRVGATGTVWHDLAWTVTQQRVHRRNAAMQWRRLVHALGRPCEDGSGLYYPPDPTRFARTAPWSLRQLGIDEKRATTLVEAARVADRLNRLADLPWSDARRALGFVPGVGPWTLACLQAFTWGDADTVITGDSGIPSLISATLTGDPRADDARMEQLLEPFRPHRYRILRLSLAARMGRRARPSANRSR